MNATNIGADAAQAIERGIALFRHLFLGEIAMAFEELGIFDYLVGREESTLTEIAGALNLKNEPLAACCEYLAVMDILHKKESGSFALAATPDHLEWYANFLLAYREVFESLAPLLTGEKRYGQDVARRGIFLKNTGAYSRGAVAFLVKRFEELGLKSAIDVGCGGGELLTALARALPAFAGIGIDVDHPTVIATRGTLAAGEYRGRISIFEGDGRDPMSLPNNADHVEAIVSLGVFHEFRKDEQIVPVLKAYKTRFPRARLFIAELDIPSWEELKREAKNTYRVFASFYKITHVFSDQGHPQPKAAWRDTLTRAGWRVVNAHEVPTRLIVYECL